jgi:hypothetical protein
VQSVTSTRIPRIQAEGGVTVFSEAENAEISIDLTAEDDGSSIAWSRSGRDSSSFDIDADASDVKMATLTSKSNPDFEQKSFYFVTVNAFDGTHTGTLSLTIHITDADDPGMIMLTPSSVKVGQTITATLQDEDAGVTGETWAWSRGGAAIDGETSSTYSAVDDDVAEAMSVSVSYKDKHLEEEDDAITVTASFRVYPDVGTAGVVTLTPPSGEVPVGQPVSAALTDVDGSPTRLRWQWKRDTVAIPGAVSRTYTPVAADAGTPVAADVGKMLSVTATYDDSVGTGNMADSSTLSVVGSTGSVRNTHRPRRRCDQPDLAVETRRRAYLRRNHRYLYPGSRRCRQGAERYRHVRRSSRPANR